MRNESKSLQFQHFFRRLSGSVWFKVFAVTAYMVISTVIVIFSQVMDIPHHITTNAEAIHHLGLVVMLAVETYHLFCHLSVFLRFRLLPRRDLVRLRAYFILDGLSALTASCLLGGRLWAMVLFHCLQHLVYFVFWERKALMIKMVSWSTLDWYQNTPSKASREACVVISVAYDVTVHVCLMLALGSRLSAAFTLLAVTLASGTYAAIFFNPRLAWSSPGAVPPWVQRRVATNCPTD